MGDTLLSSRAGLISRCAGLRAHPANDIEHNTTQAVRSFGASDFRLAACDRSPASSQESWKRSAPPGIAMPMISDQTRHRAAHMKISRSAAIMNGKFESNSNDYDESNLNRLHSVSGPRASAVPSERSHTRDNVEEYPHIAEPVIAARAQLCSSSCAHSRAPSAHAGSDFVLCELICASRTHNLRRRPPTHQPEGQIT